MGKFSEFRYLIHLGPCGLNCCECYCSPRRGNNSWSSRCIFWSIFGALAGMLATIFCHTSLLKSLVSIYPLIFSPPQLNLFLCKSEVTIRSTKTVVPATLRRCARTMSEIQVENSQPLTWMCLWNPTYFNNFNFRHVILHFFAATKSWSYLFPTSPRLLRNIIASNVWCVFVNPDLTTT